MKPVSLSACIAIAACWLLSAAGAGAVSVDEIRMARKDGGQVDARLVEAYTQIRLGDDISREAIARDVKSLEQSGRFSYVATRVEQLDGGGLSITYVVEPKLRIRRLTITGADEFGNRKIRDLLDIGVGDIIDDATLAVKALAVKEEYQKKQYPFAEITWEIEEQTANGTAHVTVRVKEGARAKIKTIGFAGNEHLSEKELKGAMRQRERHLFSWLTGSGVYNPDELAMDLVALREAYLDEGYLDVQIGEPVIEPVSSSFVSLTVPVQEGPRYRLGTIRIEGISLFPESQVRSMITNRVSDVASIGALNQTRQSLNDFYGSRGYVSTRVAYRLNPEYSRDEQGNPVVDVEYTIREGELAYIRDILIQGNSRTRDKVIRRELTVYPGQVMNEVKIRTSEARLRNLGYFSYVNHTSVDTSEPEEYDLVFDVEEQKTGQFLIGAGFSSVDDLIGFAELSQGNFDISRWPPTGGGQKLRLRGTVGTKRQDIELDFTEPWFLDRKLSLGVGLFMRDRQFLSDDYEQENIGMNLSLGKPLGRFTRLNLIYGLEQIRVFNVDEEASDIIKEEEGTRLKSSITSQIIYDTRDNYFVPTRGTRLTTAAMVAGGPLLGDTDIYGFDGRISQYFPVWYDHVLSLRGWLSVVDYYGSSDRVPIFDRLFLGGARTMRGFEYRDVGPKDENGEPVGGLSAWYASIEYTIPLAKMVRSAVFYDIGMVDDEAYTFDFGDFNSDIGVGIRFDIPGFPLRFDYAWPLEADEFNDRDNGRFQFSIGYSL